MVYFRSNLPPMMTQLSSKQSKWFFWKQWFFLINISFLGIGLDQWSKWLAQKHIAPGTISRAMPFLDWVHIWNKGISFGFFSCETMWGRSFLILLVAIFIWLLLKMYAQAVTRIHRWGFSLMIAGALSNGIDRMVHAGVFDFIRVHYASWDFPAFNVADMLISMGFLALLSEQFQWNALGFQKKPR